ncbi:hypothetical protein VC83_06980 [Pseudogymnoascus destructans]|uniref:CBM1 domain-containing protein n=2 Tax=Pseudogymnoascus destructans TaxID=655981 RepID=L8FML7_PSED2|nr:uncharacterized protein VC83_06980 [Pseudogymnoascus destructans]ELR02142.1 hypothetical protein GMDG_05301 [Pseudogymnoascus destructans 20631-21]OAF56755.2 hypothetical protein VC83_06980 [Pseudogymnoascus destructans]
MKALLISALLAATAATALPQGLGQITRIVITDAQPTAIAVPRIAVAQHLGPVSRSVIYDPQPTRTSVPRNDVPDIAKRQSIGGICSSNGSCAPGFSCTSLGGDYTLCLPDILLPSVVPITASRTDAGDTPVSSGGAIQPTNVDCRPQVGMSRLWKAITSEGELLLGGL